MSDTAASEPFKVPAGLEKKIDEVVSRYDEKRSASLMVLHALQERFGFLSKEAVEWTAAKLGLEPINVYELVTFYPMFREAPVGRHHVKVCRTLSCMLGGAGELHGHLCKRLGMDPESHGSQTTPDGEFSVEYVECLASCGTAPVMMVNDDFHEGVTLERADELVASCREPSLNATPAAKQDKPKPKSRKAPARKKSRRKA